MGSTLLSNYSKNDAVAEKTVAVSEHDELIDTEKLGTRYDQRDMTRMGRIQELRVYYLA
jgi:hypothetical protein